MVNLWKHNTFSYWALSPVVKQYIKAIFVMANDIVLDKLDIQEWLSLKKDLREASKFYDLATDLAINNPMFKKYRGRDRIDLNKLERDEFDKYCLYGTACKETAIIRVIKLADTKKGVSIATFVNKICDGALRKELNKKLEEIKSGSENNSIGYYRHNVFAHKYRGERVIAEINDKLKNAPRKNYIKISKRLILNFIDVRHAIKTLQDIMDQVDIELRKKKGKGKLKCQK